MSLEPVNIEGWKWDDIDDANTAKAAAELIFHYQIQQEETRPIPLFQNRM